MTARAMNERQDADVRYCDDSPLYPPHWNLRETYSTPSSTSRIIASWKSLFLRARKHEKGSGRYGSDAWKRDLYKGTFGMKEFLLLRMRLTGRSSVHLV